MTDGEGETGMVSDVAPAGAAIAWNAQAPQAQEPAALSDEALATRGDAASFTFLYRRHLRPIYSYLYARLGNTQEAEDVTAIAFERAWVSVKQYRATQEGSFRGWLLTIAHRALVDRYRRKSAPSVPIGDVEGDLRDPTYGPEERSVLSEQVRGVLRAMENLGHEQREVVALRFLGELSYKEVAAVVGKKEAAVKMIAYRALEEIRRRCGDE